MTTPPSWTHHRTDNSYTLTVGKARCRVWQTTTENWAAIVSQKGRAKGAYTFATLEEAQAWGIAQLAETAARASMHQAGKRR
jgi:hypothetical protein